MNWNICNFHFFPNVSFPLIYLFIYLFVWQWEHFLQLLVCSHEPQAAVLGTHMLRRSRLPTTAFIVLQQLLWRSSGCAGFNCICLPGSINPSCNFIGIFSHHPLSSITPPQSVHQLIHQHEEWRWLFKNSVYGSNSRNPQGICDMMTCNGFWVNLDRNTTYISSTQ